MAKASDANTLKIGRVAFPVSKATFRYVIDAGDGEPGWEFEIRTKPLDSLTLKSPLYRKAPRFYAEGDPVPLKNLPDLTGIELNLPEPFDEESGEPYFTLYVHEHGDLADLSLKFLEKKDSKYRIRIRATIPEGEVFSVDTKLSIDTWIEQLRATRYKG